MRKGVNLEGRFNFDFHTQALTVSNYKNKMKRHIFMNAFITCFHTALLF